ncbi:uncharacterized protein M421DRAFT_178816 [Didymella exigua CBS 183.55]|uniref:Uncharacterized protein n=1 Tax=Didymella exigua CBS 183.55 TaxID=1150837 RepID=A0A6A5RM20_9PLEO|nr:uncharacterized protein M421DRAFT_178816 [Didymella exigua CBS 183.55]KAF1927406.1 hypothetical protein M421DRAFT_178816 [Didymella exigua CBS 183.55]
MLDSVGLFSCRCFRLKPRAVSVSNVLSVGFDGCLKQVVPRKRPSSGSVWKYILQQPCAGKPMSREGCAMVSPPIISACQRVSGHESQHPTSRENVSDWPEHRFWNAERRHGLRAQAPHAFANTFRDA